MRPRAVGGSDEVERVGIDARAAHVPASVATVTGAAGMISIVARVGGPGASIRAANLRHAHVTHDQEPRVAAELDALIVDGRERARQELDRHEPAPPGAHGGRGQRDDAAADRRHGLVRGHDDRAAAVSDRHAAGQRVLAHADAEERRHVVERNELLPAQRRRRNRTTPVTGDERQR